MRRGKQQILLHYLPGQSFDVERAGAIARVSILEGAVRTDLSSEMILDRIREDLGVWQEAMRPALRDDVLTERNIVLLDPTRVDAALFPRVFWCQNRSCGAVVDATNTPRLPPHRCSKCTTGTLVQLRWVVVHRCGDLSPLTPPTCPQCHRDQMSLTLRGSERVSNFRWRCLNCQATTRLYPGLCRACVWPDASQRTGSIEVHRSNRSYYPHSTTLLNVPNRSLDALVRSPGWQIVVAAKYLGLPEARDLTLGAGAGAETRTVARDLTSEDLDRILGLQDRAPEEVLAELTRLREMRRSEGEGSEPSSLADAVVAASGVPIPVWEAAGHELLDVSTPRNHASRRSLRESANHDSGALTRLGVEDVSLVADFPIVTATYGYSRAEFAPNQARLNAFPPNRSYGGRTPIYVDEVGADAIVLELDQGRVLRWLRANGFQPTLPGGNEPTAARAGFFVQVLTGINLRETISPSEPIARLVFGLLHTFTHAAIRQAGLLCGLDRTSLSEYLLPRSLSSAVYCNHRFGATIGALTALFESSLAEWFGLVEGAERCIYDPVCGELGANCHACTQLPETSCAFYNLNLSRAFLFGGNDEIAGEVSVGYLDRQLDLDDSQPSDG